MVESRLDEHVVRAAQGRVEDRAERARLDDLLHDRCEERLGEPKVGAGGARELAHHDLGQRVCTSVSARMVVRLVRERARCSGGSSRPTSRCSRRRGRSPPTTTRNPATILRVRCCTRVSPRTTRFGPSRFCNSPSMEYRHLGRTGIRVTDLCLGAMTFGREATEDDSRAMLDRYLEAGGNFVDTANVYAGGASEEILGRVFAERPGPTRRHRARHEGPHADGRRDQRRRRIAPKHPGVGRAFTAAPADRVDRPVPDPRLRPAHAARRDAVDARRSRARGQGPLHRRQQLRGMAARQGARPLRAPRLGAVRRAAAAVLAARTRDRA